MCVWRVKSNSNARGRIHSFWPNDLCTSTFPINYLHFSKLFGPGLAHILSLTRPNGQIFSPLRPVHTEGYLRHLGFPFSPKSRLFALVWLSLSLLTSKFLLPTKLFIVVSDPSLHSLSLPHRERGRERESPWARRAWQVGFFCFFWYSYRLQISVFRFTKIKLVSWIGKIQSHTPFVLPVFSSPRNHRKRKKTWNSIEITSLMTCFSIVFTWWFWIETNSILSLVG